MRRYLFNIFFLISSLASLAMPFVVSAAGPAIQSQSNVPDFQLQIPIDTRKGFSTQELKDGKAIGMYFGDIYRWVTGAVGILAMLVFAYAGLLWLTARGEDSQVKQAQKLLVDSIAGITLVLGSYVILATINPNLVKLPALKVKEITAVEFSYDAAVETRAHLIGGKSCRDSIECVSGYCIAGVCVDPPPLNQRNGGCCFKTSTGNRRAQSSKLDACKSDLEAKLARGEIQDNPRYFCAYPPDGGTLTPEMICWEQIALSDERAKICKDFQDFTGRTAPLPVGAVLPGTCISHSDCKDTGGNVDLTKYCDKSSHKCEQRKNPDGLCATIYNGRDCLSGFCENNKCKVITAPAVATGQKGMCCYEAQDRRGSMSMGTNQVAENLPSAVSYQACLDFKEKDNDYPVIRKWFCLHKTDVSACGGKSGSGIYHSWNSIDENECQGL